MFLPITYYCYLVLVNFLIGCANYTIFVKYQPSPELVRRSMTCMAAEAGLAPQQIMLSTGHKNDNAIQKYIVDTDAPHENYHQYKSIIIAGYSALLVIENSK